MLLLAIVWIVASIIWLCADAPGWPARPLGFAAFLCNLVIGIAVFFHVGVHYARDGEPSPDRSHTHGERMNNAADVAGSMSIVHCCACWRYTDDMNERSALLSMAAGLIGHATPAIEQTDAYKAADKLVTAAFSPPPFIARTPDPYRLG